MVHALDADGPICVFDSGVGGLSVLRHIRRELPRERLLYIADSRYVPYGGRAEEFVVERSMTIARFAATQGAKALVVACNTATAAAVSSLRAAFEFPIVGVEPGIKPAAAASRSGVVGVLATENTLQSRKFFSLIERFGNGTEVVVQACPALVRQVEEGDFDSAETRDHIRQYVEPLREHGADVLVLGCTHFPFLTPLIQEIAGPDVVIVDTGPAVAKEVRRRLVDMKLLCAGGVANETLFTSDESLTVAPLLQRLWSEQVTIERLPAEFQ